MAFSVKACYRSGLLLQFNSVESSSRKVVEKSGSMKPIVIEVVQILLTRINWDFGMDFRRLGG